MKVHQRIFLRLNDLERAAVLKACLNARAGLCGGEDTCLEGVGCFNAYDRVATLQGP